jgi:O-antigen ligase
VSKHVTRLGQLAWIAALAFAAFAPWSVAGMQIAGGIAVGAGLLLWLQRVRPVNALNGPVLIFLAAAALAWALNGHAPNPDMWMPKVALGAAIASAAVATTSREPLTARRFAIAATLVISMGLVSVLALYQVRTGFDLLFALHLRAQPLRVEAPDAPGLFAALGAYSRRLTYAHTAAIVAGFVSGAVVDGGLTRRWKMIFAIAGSVIAAGVVAAYARSALLSVVIAVALVLVSRRRQLRRALIPAAALVAALALALAVIPGSGARLARTLNLQSNQDRVFIWSRAAEMLARTPTYGVGPGAYPVAAQATYDFADPTFQMHTWAHDTFLSLWLELGFFGLMAFVGLFIAYFAAIRRTPTPTTNGAASALRLGSITATLSFLLLCVFHDAAYSAIPGTVGFFLMGLGVVQPAIDAPTQAPS